MVESILLAIVVGVIAGGIFFFILTKISRPERFATGEDESATQKAAEERLEKQGFTIIERKARRNVVACVDGKNHYSFVEADFLVKLNKNRYLVAIHNSEIPFDPNEPANRRRLIEGQTVFKTEAALVVNPTSGAIEKISFQFPRVFSLDAIFQKLIIGFIFLVVIGIIWLLINLHLY